MTSRNKLILYYEKQLKRGNKNSNGLSPSLFTPYSLLQWNIPQWRHINAQFFSKVARVRSRTLRIVWQYRLGLFYTVWISATSPIFVKCCSRSPESLKVLYSQVHDVWCPVVLWHTGTQQIGGSICPSVSGGHLSLSQDMTPWVPVGFQWVTCVCSCFGCCCFFLFFFLFALMFK